MSTARIGAANFYLESVWKAVNSGGSFVMETGPTEDTKTVRFGYSLPSGAKIRMACIRASVSTPLSGISLLTVNGASLTKLSGFQRNANVTIYGNSGTLQAKFVFKANGELADALEHTSRINFSDVHLLIEYDPPVPVQPNEVSGYDGLSAPPQAACIYVQDSGKVYSFDGIIKVQHSASIKIEEETDDKKSDSKKKYSYVNNARNEADKVSLEVIMSDVYSGGGFDDAGAGSTFRPGSAYMAERDSSRSENAYSTLHKLKEDRELITVATEEFVYTDMLLESISVVRDENTQHGWTGTLSFQHIPEAPTSTQDKTSSKPKTKNNVVTNTESIYVGVLNRIAGASKKGG